MCIDTYFNFSRIHSIFVYTVRKFIEFNHSNKLTKRNNAAHNLNFKSVYMYKININTHYNYEVIRQKFLRIQTFGVLTKAYLKRKTPIVYCTKTINQTHQNKINFTVFSKTYKITDENVILKLIRRKHLIDFSFSFYKQRF